MTSLPYSLKLRHIRDGIAIAVVASGGLAVNAGAQEEGPAVPIGLFQAPEGLEVTRWANSPMLFNPTNMDVDAEGRIWVAEGVNYRGHSGRRAEGDRIVVLEDTDLDGVADSSHTFVQERFLEAPLGVAVIGNQVVVSMTPDMIVYTDLNENRVFEPGVDKREVLLTGFANRQHDHTLHSVTAGPDGQWYWNVGNCGAEFTDRSGQTFRIGSPYSMSHIAGATSDDGNVWIGGFTARMNPDGTDVNIIGHNYRNSYEQTITSFGDVFQNDNDDPAACRVTHVLEYGNAGFASADGQRSWRADQRPGQTTKIAEWRQEDPGVMPAGDVYGGGSPTGVAYYENGALGDKWRGLLLSCEAGRNVVFGYLPRLEGSAFKLERFEFLTSNPEHEFAGSDFLGGAVNYETKTLFRPSDVVVGADGAIYVSDWYDARVGGHQDLDETVSGAIYRIAPRGFEPEISKPDLSQIKGQIAALKSPAVNVRNSGYRKLKAAGEDAVLEVSKLLDSDNPYFAARATWLLSEMGEAGRKDVEALIGSDDEMTRIVAFRALRRVDHQFLELAQELAEDPSPAVRREVALALRNVQFEDAKEPWLTLADLAPVDDPTYLEALGTGAHGKESKLYQELIKSAPKASQQWPRVLAQIVWRLHPPEAVDAIKYRALAPSLKKAERKLMVDALAFIPTKRAAMAMVELAQSPGFAFKSEALWWALNRKNNHWSDFGMDEALKASGLYDPSNVTLFASEIPDGSRIPSALPDIETIVAMKGDATRGKGVAARCYVCHEIDGAGVGFGPDLTEFGATQTRETIVRSIVEPSAEISHGFDGSEVITTDGIKIQGIILSANDPVMIKSMGGQIQTIPKDRVAEVKRLKRSLMMWPSQLGLTAQDIADVTAYLVELGNQ